MKKTSILLLIGLFLYADLALAAYNRTYIGVNYLGFPQSTDQINQDLEVLAPHFGYVRTYNSLFGPDSPENQVVPLVAAFNQAHPATPMKVAIGVALTPGNPSASQNELAQAIANAKANPSAVNAVVVGNENLGNISETDLINYLNYAKAQLQGTGIAVTTCQTWGVLYGHPDLVNACSSYVLANIYPYWDGPGYNGGNQTKAGAATLKNWKTRFLTAYNQLVAQYGAAKIRIGETGWPSGGSQVKIDGHWTGVPSQTAAYPNEQTYIEQYAAWAGSKHLFTYLFSAINENWKVEPGGVGPYWGLYTENLTAKWPLGHLPAIDPGSTLFLGTDSPYGALDFNGGALLIVDPQTLWGNAFSISPGTTSTLNNGGCDFTHTGALTGGGNLIHVGPGLTRLQGDGSGFSGTLTLQGGVLNLSNTLGGNPLPCTVVVDGGGVLTGSGPVVGSLTNSGAVNPGNSPGALNVVGSYVQTANGQLRTEVASAGSYDKLNVTGIPGTAQLDGLIAPTLLGGYRPRGNQIFPGVVNAGGGVSGSFSNILNPRISPTLFWQTRYHPASVDLWVERCYTDSGLNLNSNQFAVGAMLNRVAGVTAGDLDTVLNALDYLPHSAGVREAFKQISPEKAAALSALAFAEANLQKGVLSRRITNLRFGSRESGTLGGLPGSLNLNYSRAAGLALAYSAPGLAGMLTSEKKAGFSPPAGRWSVYLDPAVVLGSRQSSTNQTGFDFTIAGFNAGADYRLIDDLLVGLATGYSHTGAGFRDSGGGVQSNTWPLTAYVAYLPQSFYAYGCLGYALNLFDLERQISFGGLNRSAKSSPRGHQFNLYAETGYDLRWRGLVATPVVSLAYSSLWVNGFNENGASALNLRFSPQQAASLQTGVGGKLALPLKRGSMVVVPQVYATCQHEYLDNSRGLDARLSQAGNTFTFQTDSPRRNFALLGANLNILTQGNLQVHLDYSAEVGRGNYTAHYLSGGMRWQF